MLFVKALTLVNFLQGQPIPSVLLAAKLPIMLLRIIACALLLCCALGTQAQNTAPKLKKYYLVLLVRGDSATSYDADTSMLRRLQASHMANIGRMHEMGKLVIAGPFGNAGRMRGIFIMHCATEAEVRELLKADGAVAAGRLKAEVYEWYSQPGARLPE